MLAQMNLGPHGSAFGPRLCRPERGETLTGLLVGLSVGLVVLAAGSALLASQLRAHRAALQDSHWHTDVRSAMDWMARELRQAQYSGKAWQTRSAQTCTDPFCATPLNFRIVNDQIDFSHDRNHDGSKDDDECLGFRITQYALHVRRSCQDSGGWQALTDRTHVRVTHLQWAVHCTDHNGWWHRTVHMTLKATWPNEPDRPITLTQTVQLRNALPSNPAAPPCQ
jgi:type II secretory pathway component PulJ